MNNLSEIMVKDVSEKEKIKKMYDWSKGIQKFQDYKEREGMEDLIAQRLGKKEYLFPKDIYIQKNKQDIYFAIDVNLQEYHIHYDEPTWHSYCYGRSLEAYLLFLHSYIQNQEGVVYLEMKYTHKVPHMNELFLGKDKKHWKNQEGVYEQEYFLLIYRIRNLVRMFSWVKLSDKLEAQVQELEQLLKKINFYSKVTGNHLLCENIFLERIKAKFSDEIVKKNFSFWLFREEGKYRKTCIELIDAADLWWIKDSNLTLLFFGIQSFEKGILKMLLFMGLGLDLFLEKNLKMIDADRLKLGYEMEGCDGMKVSKIQCILYDIASIDTMYKEIFSALNDNHYNDRIHFRYLDGVVLNNETLLELQKHSEQEGTD